MHASRWTLLLAVLLGAKETSALGAPAPLAETQVVPLPGVQRRIDHLALDVPGRRLFVAALGNGTLEVLDLASGKRVRSVGGLQEPQGVAYLPALHRVAVATAGGSLLSYDDREFKPLATVAHVDDADNLRVDAKGTLLYLGYGDGALAVFDPGTLERLGEVKLPGHPESFRVESAGPRIFVNVPRTREVLVVDRDRRAIASHIPLGGSFSRNYPMYLDEAHHRLFVGVRSPARLLVFDTGSGKTLAALPCVGDTDDLFYDPRRDRVYVIGGEGFVDVFDASAAGKYGRLAHIATRSGARTGLWSDELGQLFVAWPARAGEEAAVHVLAASSSAPSR
jgi:DNA-binding beta-propeller fold protein YncE